MEAHATFEFLNLILPAPRLTCAARMPVYSATQATGDVVIAIGVAPITHCSPPLRLVGAAPDALFNGDQLCRPSARQVLGVTDAPELAIGDQDGQAATAIPIRHARSDVSVPERRPR